MEITPDLINKMFLGVGGLITTWFTGRAMLKRSLFSNGNGDTPERRKNTISPETHKACLANRTKEENRLFKGQEKIEIKIENEIKGIRAENKNDFQRIYDKIDEKCNLKVRNNG